MSDNAQWYVVHTYSGYEKKVKATIEKAVENLKMQDLILKVSVPTEEVIELPKEGDKNKGKKQVERKLFPGYVLVKMIMTDDSWHAVRNTRGVTGFVGPGSKPVPLTEAEVLALGVEKRVVIVPYAVGDSVTIIDGALKSFIGVVEEIDLEKNMVRVVVSMFGRETPVVLTLDQVQPVVV